jgi:hypothetical protein
MSILNVSTIQPVGSGQTVTVAGASLTYFESSTRRVVALTSGDTTLWYQASAPIGWTKQTTHNDKALRVVSGTGGAAGGSTAFTTVMASRTPTGSVSVSNAAVTLSISEIPAHSHPVTVSGADDNNHTGNGPTAANSDAPQNATNNTSNTGGGGSHTHNNTASFSGSAMDFAVQYIDIILCSID